jgi:hypothetical protein
MENRRFAYHSVIAASARGRNEGGVDQTERGRILQQQAIEVAFIQNALAFSGLALDAIDAGKLVEDGRAQPPRPERLDRLSGRCGESLPTRRGQLEARARELSKPARLDNEGPANGADRPRVLVVPLAICRR